ncbi:hypothetical protein AGMMS4952_27510 [Spirochaetia bacterium]|nr:hypothetical protein AGMMS4952_27510 [Spirochaetia bacterium]
METGLLYVVHNEWIRNPETKKMPYKIGITKKTVDDRYYGLGLKMPGEFICDFAYYFPKKSYAEVEKILHSLYDKYRVNGEWFELPDGKLNSIQEACVDMDGVLQTEVVENSIDVKINLDDNVINSNEPELEKNKNVLQGGNGMGPSFEGIVTFFQKNGIKMSLSKKDENYACSKTNKDGIHFAIRSEHNEFIFYWRTSDESKGKFADKFPKIEAWCLDKKKNYKIKPGSKNPNWRRLYIEVDQAKPPRRFFVYYERNKTDYWLDWLNKKDNSTKIISHSPPSMAEEDKKNFV